MQGASAFFEEVEPAIGKLPNPTEVLADPEPKLPAPDPDPEWDPPGVSPVPVRDVEPGPDVIDPGLEPLPA